MKVSIQCARVRSLSTGRIASTSAARLAVRSRPVRKRGSSAHSGRPAAWANFTQSRWLPAATQIGRSAVSKVW